MNEELLPFDLQAYLANPERLRYSNGKNPAKSKWDEDFKVLLIDCGDGSVSLCKEHYFILLRLAPLPKTQYWVNVHQDETGFMHTSGALFNSLKEAIDASLLFKTGSVKIAMIEI